MHSQPFLRKLLAGEPLPFGLDLKLIGLPWQFLCGMVSTGGASKYSLFSFGVHRYILEYGTTQHASQNRVYKKLRIEIREAAQPGNRRWPHLARTDGT